MVAVGTCIDNVNSEKAVYAGGLREGRRFQCITARGERHGTENHERRTSWKGRSVTADRKSEIWWQRQGAPKQTTQPTQKATAYARVMIQ